MSQERDFIFSEKPPFHVTKLRTSNSEQKIVQLPHIHSPSRKESNQHSVYFNYYIVERRTGLPVSEKARIMMEKEKRREKINDLIRPTLYKSQKRINTDTTKPKIIDFSIHPYFSI